MDRLGMVTGPLQASNTIAGPPVSVFTRMESSVEYIRETAERLEALARQLTGQQSQIGIAQAGGAPTAKPDGLFQSLGDLSAALDSYRSRMITAISDIERALP